MMTPGDLFNITATDTPAATVGNVPDAFAMTSTMVPPVTITPNSIGANPHTFYSFQQSLAKMTMPNIERKKSVYPGLIKALEEKLRTDEKCLGVSKEQVDRYNALAAKVTPLEQQHQSALQKLDVNNLSDRNTMANNARALQAARIEEIKMHNTIVGITERNWNPQALPYPHSTGSICGGSRWRF